MNDQSEDTTQVMPPGQPDPAGEQNSEASELDLSQWRRIAITTTSLFVVTLVVLGWQLSTGSGSAQTSQQLNGNRGPGGQTTGQPQFSTPPDGQQQGGAPQMGGQSQDGTQSQSGAPSTRSS